jgi:NTE family protein
MASSANPVFVVIHGLCMFRLPCFLSLLVIFAQPLHAADTTFVVAPRFRAPFAVERGILPRRTLDRPKVGLVLSGGGARGVSQIGVLKALERHNIPVDFIAATSMGAIIGGLYAAGYTTAQLESLAVTTNWDEVLTLSDDTRRTQLFVDQKMANDRSFLTVRFQGFDPVIPPAVSSGQRLTDFLSAKMLQALYLPFPDFDHLKIPFRAVATDLVSGRRVVLAEGSLAEALRASSTVPLLFSPIERGGMWLVDGGLVANVPVDIAREAGCDIAIVVNSTSGLRTVEEMKSPWQTADQIMGIMMEKVNEVQTRAGDVVITPDIGRHLGSNFNNLDSLIRLGERSAEQHIGEITALYDRKADSLEASRDTLRLSGRLIIRRDTTVIPDSLWQHILSGTLAGPTTVRTIRSLVERLYATGDLSEATATVSIQSGEIRIQVNAVPNPGLVSVQFQGCRMVDAADLRPAIVSLAGKTLNHDAGEHALERMLEIYRERGYSLAHFDTTLFDAPTGKLTLVIDEGIIGRIDVLGGGRTQDAFVLREFSLMPGEVFEIDKARKGLSNLSGTTLFEYVYLEVISEAGQLRLTIRLKERPTQLVRLGLRADDERQLQGLLDIRDENFRGTGLQLGLTIAGGQRNTDIVLEYKAQRLFDTDLSFNVNAFHKVYDSYVYGNASPPAENRWRREQVGEYHDIRYGVSLSFGSLLERLGKATAELILQNVRLVSLENATSLEERYRLGLIRLGTIVDTKNSYPFPTAGIGLKLSYEFSLPSLGSDVSYNALQVMYETYSSWGEFITFHPRFTMGIADRTVPLAQQFRLGGRESMYGLSEDDRRGRQLLLVNMEVRFFLPVRFLFDTYLRVRYDLGTISAVPEEIKFSSLLHGVGLELALDTPIGPAVFGTGKTLFFGSALPGNPVQQGPFLVYLMIGYQL